jgi:hypothetical protein
MTVNIGVAVEAAASVVAGDGDPARFCPIGPAANTDDVGMCSLLNSGTMKGIGDGIEGYTGKTITVVALG